MKTRGLCLTRNIFIVGALVSAAITLVSFALVSQQDAEPDDGYLVRSFDGSVANIDRLLVRSDGQAFAAVAVDPLVEDPDVFRGGLEEAAYRAQRPLYPWLGYLVGTGDVERTKYALLAVNVVSGGLLVAASMLLVKRRGGACWLGMAVMATPAVFLSLGLATAEILAMTFVLWGLVAWSGESRMRWLSVGLFAAGVLTRESMLLVPAAVLFFEVLRGGRSGLRAAWPLALSVVPYLGWVLALELRLGVWPVGNQQGRLAAPMVGILDVVGTWSPADYILFALLVAPVVVATRHRADVLAWVVIFQVPLLVVAGPLVMYRWQDFGRVFGLVYVVGLILWGSSRFPLKQVALR